MSERWGRLLLSLYPPFLCQRIRIASVGPGYRTMTVRISQSLLNRNLNGTIFGGTIYAAADPIYALMWWQILAREGLATRVWLRRSSVRFLQPGRGTLTLRFEIDDASVARALAALESDGRFVETYETPVVDSQGETCAVVETEVQARLR